MKIETLTHKNLSEIVGVSVTTIKSYRKKFGEYIPVAGHGKPLRFEKKAADVCLRIRELFGDGLSVKQISEKLSHEFNIVDDNHRLSTIKKDQGLGPKDMEQLLKLSSQMMNGMAALVTAQAKAEKRVERVEKKLGELLEIQDRNSSILNDLLEKNESAPVTPQSGKVKAKLVTIRGNDGDDKSYRIERENEVLVPDQDLLELPVVIRSDEGDFLGMPGANGSPFNLRGLLTFVSSTEAADSASHVWRRDSENWVLTSSKSNAEIHELHFKKTKTPKGNLVAFFERLDINSVQQNRDFLLKFFRDARDSYYGQ
jgi:DNA-binding transcriptional MerR regulator